MLKVTGRVYVQETDKGLEGLHIKAVDKDLSFDDVLGTAVTGKDGRFEITYEKKDFSELFEKSPDLYVIVRDPKSGRIIYSSEDSVRCDADGEENIDVPIPQRVIDEASGASSGPYGPEKGVVKISLTGAALPDEVTLFFTEHRRENRKQHKIVAQTGKGVSVDLPSGEYTMQIAARGFETVRGLAEVDPKRPVSVEAVLKPRQKKVPTFEERLAKYGVKPQEVGELNVPRGTTLALNHQKDRERRGFKMLEADKISKVKAWVGNDDARLGHDRPIYGPLPDQKHLARLLADGVDLKKLNADEVKAVTLIAQEYVQGNSKAVSRYESFLDTAILATAVNGITRIPLYCYTVVTIEAGATLEIGNGSAIFHCGELRIHKTGQLKPVANVTIEIGTYTEFG